MTLSSNQNKICLIPRVSPFGGPGSFCSSLVDGLKRRGILTTQDLSDPSITTVLVIGGTRNLPGLIQARRQGKRIVQRLNGMNWMHRAGVGPSSRSKVNLRYFIRSEINNFLLAFIRKRVATSIVYQSQFSMDWWTRVYGEVKTASRTIYNAVDLDKFTPDGPADLPPDRCRILLVEGNISGGYQLGLENAVNLADQLQAQHRFPVELKVIGSVPESIQSQHINRPVSVSWSGMINRDQVPFADRSAHMLFSSDLNAACPNSVIEAMACGLPIVTSCCEFNDDLVDDTVAIRIDPMDVSALRQAIALLRDDPERRRRMAQAALSRSAQFDIDRRAAAICQFMTERI